ncbi:DUF6247 family protein [Pseudonocardia acaciae]|uniref:DUF6247 family protein n=1 Tax=Pseudonocardia acaciae TaxID=551276 RepID=UPI00048C2E7A|nr:DUF6247 family protein [Pseudonocardia acaciae]
MASPARLSHDEPLPPAADPVAIRRCLTPDVAAEFDREWETVLDRAKQTKDLSDIHDLLAKWRLFAHAELKEPGSYFRVLATAAHTAATGRAPAGSVSGDEIKELIRARLGR